MTTALDLVSLVLLLALALGAFLGMVLAAVLVAARTPDEPPSTDDLK